MKKTISRKFLNLLFNSIEKAVYVDSDSGIFSINATECLVLKSLGRSLKSKLEVEK